MPYDQSLYDGLLDLAGMASYSQKRPLGLMMILGYALEYLNKQSNKLSYFSEAVYPFYIVHQSIIVLAGSSLCQFEVCPIIEPLMLFTIAVSSCFICYEIIRRTLLLRPVFDLKQIKPFSTYITNLGFGLAVIIILPPAYK
jgi:hypothetical protein